MHRSSYLESTKPTAWGDIFQKGRASQCNH